MFLRQLWWSEFLHMPTQSTRMYKPTELPIWPVQSIYFPLHHARQDLPSFL